MANMIFAIKDEKVVHIDSVENGLACNCKCIACDAKLVARNNGVVREHHFAHYGCDDTSICYEKSMVSVMSRVIKKAGKISLPELSVLNNNECKEVVKNGFTFEYCTVEVLKRVEIKDGGYYTLLLLKDKSDNRLEVIVSCGVKKGYEYTIGNFENSRIEISLDDTEVVRMQDLNEILLGDRLSGKWIYNKKAEMIKNELNIMQQEDVTNECIVQKQIGDEKRNITVEGIAVKEFVSQMEPLERNHPEFNKKLGKKIWEENFKGKRLVK